MIESFLDNTDAQDAKAKLLAQLDPLGLSRQFAPVPVPSPQSLQDWNSTLNGIPLPIRRSAPQRRVGASNGDIAAFGSPLSGPISVAMSMMANARKWQAAHPNSDVPPTARQPQPMIFGRDDPNGPKPVFVDSNSGSLSPSTPGQWRAQSWNPGARTAVQGPTEDPLYYDAYNKMRFSVGDLEKVMNRGSRKGLLPLKNDDAEQPGSMTVQSAIHELAQALEVPDGAITSYVVSRVANAGRRGVLSAPNAAERQYPAATTDPEYYAIEAAKKPDVDLAKEIGRRMVYGPDPKESRNQNFYAIKAATQELNRRADAAANQPLLRSVPGAKIASGLVQGLTTVPEDALAGFSDAPVGKAESIAGQAKTLSWMFPLFGGEATAAEAEAGAFPKTLKVPVSAKLAGREQVPLTPISRVADDGVASAWNTGSRLVEHVQDALSNPATNRRLVLGPVDEAQRMQLKAVGGQDLANHWFVIDGSNIRHVVKSHGDPIAEALRGQSAVDSDVWTSLPSVLQHPDHVEYLGMQNGAPQYGFWKKINGHAFTVLVERSGKQVLQVQSVRVHKNPLY